MDSPSPESVILIIGAGLAGLAAALRLARAGHRVVLLEAGPAHGGCCSTTEVDGFSFNNGAVYVAVPSLLRRAFADLGLDLDAEVPMSAIERPLESHLGDGSVVHLADAATSYVEGPRGTDRTQLLRQGLADLQRDWAPVYRALVDHVLPGGPSPWNALRHLGLHLPKMRGSRAKAKPPKNSRFNLRTKRCANTFTACLTASGKPTTSVSDNILFNACPLGK